jgi:hypothetical protein
MDSIDCGDLHSEQSRVGALGKSELALVHSFRWRKPVSVITHPLVLDGGYPGQVGNSQKRSAGGEHSAMMLRFLEPTLKQEESV